MELVEKIDFLIIDFIRENLSCGFLDLLMEITAKLGDKGIIWIISAALMMMWKKYNRCGVTTLASLAAGAVVGNLLLKNIFQRERPCWINDGIEMLIAIPRDYSFPSGHTLSAVAAAVTVYHFDKKLSVPFCIFAVMTAFSRLYLYVHFPTDVIVGAVVGAATAYFVCILSDRLADRKGIN